MIFVLDASVAISWCFEDEATPATEALLDRLGEAEAVVPALWFYEVANVLVVAERRGRLTEAQAERFIGLLGRLPIRVEPGEAPMSSLLAIGRRHGLSAYDAAYLALAEHPGLPLASLDSPLRAAARRAGVADALM